jgi:hypothetical protein
VQSDSVPTLNGVFQGLVDAAIGTGGLPISHDSMMSHPYDPQDCGGSSVLVASP